MFIPIALLSQRSMKARRHVRKTVHDHEASRWEGRVIQHSTRNRISFAKLGALLVAASAPCRMSPR